MTNVLADLHLGYIVGVAMTINKTHGIALVKETAKAVALRLVANGCTDAKRSVLCSRCSERYLLLILPQDGTGIDDAEVRPKHKKQASFAAMLRLDHRNGHQADHLIARHESAMNPKI